MARRVHLVRLLPFLPGRTAAAGELDATAVRGIGQVSARLGVALRGFFHPAAAARSSGTRSTCPTWCATQRSWRTPTGAGSSTACWSASWSARCRPCRLCGLRSSTTTSPWTTCCSTRPAAVSGIIDFGDMTHTALLLDVPATLQSLVRDRRGHLRGGRRLPARLQRGAAARAWRGRAPGRPCSPVAWRRPSSSPPGGRASSRITPTSGAGRNRHGHCSTSWSGLAWTARRSDSRAWRWLPWRAAAQRRRPRTTRFGPDARRCSAARSSRSATRGRCTWSGAPARGCSTPTATPSWTRTTTSRWSATPIHG